MESITFRNVDDPPAAERRTLETIVGRPFEPHELVSIRIYPPKAELDEGVRQAARENLERTFAKIDEHGKAHGVTPEEADAAVEEAMQQIRPRNS